SHFTKMIKIDRNSVVYYITVKTDLQLLLPRPYRTDCYDYESNRMASIGHKSRADCMLEVMKQIERKKCQNNDYWVSHKYQNKSQLIINDTINACIVTPDNKLLYKVCKVECNHYLTNFMIHKQRYFEQDINILFR